MYEYRKLTPEQRARLVEERLLRGFPPHSPPHPVQSQTLYLLTAACYEHKHYIRNTQRREEIISMLFEELNRSGIEIHAWVVLTNHYHLLVQVG